MCSKDTPAKGPSRGPETCQECRRLLDVFGESVQELVVLHEQQFLEIVDGEPECNRFDLLIHMANEKKQEAKYAYLQHVDAHDRSTKDGIDQS